MDIQRFKLLTLRVLEIVDDLGIHREAISIPLESSPRGDVRMPTPDRIEIVGPEGDPEPFLASLRDRLCALDLSRVPRA